LLSIYQDFLNKGDFPSIITSENLDYWWVSRYYYSIIKKKSSNSSFFIKDFIL
jgi:hypothetical protein